MDGYTVILDWVVAQVGLSKAAVYGMVWRYCQMSEGICRASTRSMALRLGVSRSTLMRHLADLVKEGLVVDYTPDATGSPHVYRVVSRDRFTPTEEPSAECDTSPEAIAECDRGCSKLTTEPIANCDTKNTSRNTTKISVPPNAGPMARIMSLIEQWWDYNPSGVEYDVNIQDALELVEQYGQDAVLYAFNAAHEHNAGSWAYIKKVLANQKDGVPKPSRASPDMPAMERW